MDNMAMTHEADRSIPGEASRTGKSLAEQVAPGVDGFDRAAPDDARVSPSRVIRSSLLPRYSMQQLIRLMSWWNDSAAIFSASEKVGNVWTVSMMSSIVRPPRMAYAAACTMSAAIGETM